MWRSFSPLTQKRVIKNPCLSKLTNRTIGPFTLADLSPIAVSVSSSCQHDSSLSRVDPTKLTKRSHFVSSTYPLTDANRELVTEQLQSLSATSACEDEDDVELRSEMDSTFDAFKVGVDSVLKVAARFSMGSRFHNYLRTGVGAAVERLVHAFDLEPSPGGKPGEFAVDVNPSQNVSRSSGATPDSAASEFAAALPDDPAAQIEAFRIILNQLKIRVRQQ